MFACRLLIGFALAASTSSHYRAADPLPASEPKPPPADPVLGSTAKVAGEQIGTDKPAVADPSTAATPRGENDGHMRNPNAELEPIAHEFFAKGRYKEALDAYTRWTPRSFCANCSFSMRDIRYRRIALCHSHLGEHTAAARACLEAAGKQTLGDIGAAVFTVQLYREAGQLDDLGPLLDAIEKGIIDKQHPKARLLPPDERFKLLGLRGTLVVRNQLKSAQLGEVKPWPDGVPKPKAGSLPKTLPKT